MIKSIIKFCSKISKDELLVQGAGGNVSYKINDNEMLIKASGTWLEDASKKNIFVNVDLNKLMENINNNNFNKTPVILSKSKLKPSIETYLHAFFKHKVVVHLHAIEILSHLVRSNYELLFNKVLSEFKWINIPYFTPGTKLVKALKEKIGSESFDIIFLQNHGVVIGGKNIHDIEKILISISKILKTNPIKINFDLRRLKSEFLKEKTKYKLIFNEKINALVFDNYIFKNLESFWSLYPDHIVFLGPIPYKFNCINDFLNNNYNPAIIFIKEVGVFIEPNLINRSKIDQLNCFANVLLRQEKNFNNLNTLSKSNINELINWDAEEYRIALSK